MRTLACSALVLVTGLMPVAVVHAAPFPAGPLGSSSQSTYLLPSMSGTALTSLLTVGDAAGNGYRMAGIPDGLGAFDNGDGTFTLLMNHELGTTAGGARTHAPFTTSEVCTRFGLSTRVVDEKLKALTRGKRITAPEVVEFVRSLDIPEAEKARLVLLTPATYVGNAAEQARRI